MSEDNNANASPADHSDPNPDAASVSQSARGHGPDDGGAGSSGDDPRDMDEDEARAFNEEKEAELHATLDDEVGSLSETEQSALDALSEATEGDTETVELANGITVEVKTYLKASVEDRLDAIAKANGKGASPRDMRDDMVAVLAWIINDPDYGSAGVWDKYARKYGTPRLAKIFTRAVDPALSELSDAEDTRSFRPDR